MALLFSSHCWRRVRAKGFFQKNAQFSLAGQTNGAGDWGSGGYNANGTLSLRTDAGEVG